MIRPASRLRRFGSRAGSAMLEFALGSGILVTIFVSTFQYGYFFYQYNLVENVVNNGAHFAAMQVYDTNTSTPTTAWTTAVKKMVLYGDPTGGSTTPASEESDHQQCFNHGRLVREAAARSFQLR